MDDGCNMTSYWRSNTDSLVFLYLHMEFSVRTAALSSVTGICQTLPSPAVLIRVEGMGDITELIPQLVFQYRY